MEKKLFSFIKDIEYTIVCNEDINPTITNLVFDSREVNSQSLFFALPGTHVHGNTFIEKVIDSGCLAVVFQDQIPDSLIEKAKNAGAILLQVPNSRFSMSPIAAEFYDHPGNKLGIFGITGTEGKSTTVYLVWQLLRMCGKKAGFISTVSYSLGDEDINNPEHQTTPEAPIIQAKLAQMVSNGCEYAVIESSSHGLSEKTNRLGDVPFDAVAMMNVTHEHLEFHGTQEQYKFDKANLFRALDTKNHFKTILGHKRKIPAFGVVNMEDPSAFYFIEATEKPVFGFTTNGEAGASTKGIQDIEKSEKNTKKPESVYIGDHIQSDKEGSTFIIHEPDSVSPSINTRMNLPGTFNVYNTLAALLLVSKVLGVDIAEIKHHAAKLLPVKGRMTVIEQGQPFEVLVDYAHTPSSFRTIFPPLRKRAKGKIFCLFGSGGERDTKKRPEQGKIASEYCDVVILTDEDPRGEDPVTLLKMIAEGCKNKTAGKDLFIIPNRQQAIRKAFSMANPDDIILLLGKAHENSIIYKDYVMPYDEISEAIKALNEAGYTK
jgi:UDP-N-acetylmuramoyl-L-alanyl-D-glutamate--2,6-diaminopimelate ligase